MRHVGRHPSPATSIIACQNPLSCDQYACLQVELATALEAALQPQAPLAASLNEVGALQLAFDAHLIAQALARPPGPPNGGSTAAAAVERLQTAVVALLDPVDWAAYRSHMVGLVQGSLARKALLLGLLLRCNPADAQVRLQSPAALACPRALEPLARRMGLPRMCGCPGHRMAAPQPSPRPGT